MSHEPPASDANEQLGLVEADVDGGEVRYVRMRPLARSHASAPQQWRPDPLEPYSTVITEYGSTHERPDGYPAELPFVAGVEICTTTGGGQAPSARFSCTDPDAVLSSIVQQCEAAGWNETDQRLELPGSHPTRQVLLQRGGHLRTLGTYPIGRRWLVQLVDAPSESLRRWLR